MPEDKATEHAHPTNAGEGLLFRTDTTSHQVKNVLIPRPTTDPRDPLTWSSLRKHMSLFNIGLFVFLSNYVTASITPAFVALAEEFNESETNISYLITCNILALGLGNLFWIPLSLKIGKRPVLIVSLAIFFGACIWAGKAESYSSMLAARIIQGFGASSSEALGPSIVADVFFLHERGTKVSFYTVNIAAGSAFGGIFGGLVFNANSDWRWIFWMNSILTGFCLLLTIVFQPETNFKRPYDTEIGNSSVAVTELENTNTTNRIFKTFASNFNFWSWYDRDVSIWSLFARPVPLLLLPAVAWGSLIYGVTLGWIVLAQTANSFVFPAEYTFSPLAVGNINVAVSSYDH